MPAPTPDPDVEVSIGVEESPPPLPPCAELSWPCAADVEDTVEFWSEVKELVPAGLLPEASVVSGSVLGFSW